MSISFSDDLWTTCHCYMYREAAFCPQWMCDPVSLLCFVIRYCQLRVTENPDSTSLNNKECIMSPNKKPGDIHGGSGLVYTAGECQHRAARCSLPACAAGSVCCPASLKVAGRLRASQPCVLPLEHQRQVKRTFVTGQRWVHTQ